MTFPSKTSDDEPSAGTMRFISEKRQVGGLLLVTGFCALIQPLGGIVTAVGKDTTVASSLGVASLIGGLCLAKLGLLSVFAGYSQVVHDHVLGGKYLIGYLILWTQTAFIPYITGMVQTGRNAKDQVALIPEDLEPTASDYNWVGAMGICGILSYGFSFFGACAFMQFTLYAFYANKPHDRPGSYYCGRMSFYCLMHFIAGLSQLMLGSYIIKKFGGAVMDTLRSTSTYRYVVSFPAINCTVGSIQILNALWGFARSCGIGVFGGDYDYMYQLSMYMSWFLQIVLQVVVQVGYVPGSGKAPAAATIAAMTIGLNMMPAYLDFKMRTVPEEISGSYFGIAEHSMTHQIEDAQGTEEQNTKEAP